MKFYFLTCSLALFCSLQAQTGPGGVDNSTNNVLWLRADKGTNTTTSGYPVSSWLDQSGNGNNVYQANAAQQPVLIANGINGLPVLSFDNIYTAGQNDKMRGSNSATLDNTSGMTFFTVSQPRNLDASTARSIVVKRTGVSVNQSFMLFYYTGNKFFLDIQDVNDRFSTAATFSNNITYLVDAMYDGTLAQNQRSTIYVSGDLNVTSGETNTLVPNNPSSLWIGTTDSADARPFGGYIAEVIEFRRTLNSAERLIVDNYLSAKYSTTLTTVDRYAGDNNAKGDYDYDVAGIGVAADGSNLSFGTSRCAGLGITQFNNFGTGDYLFAGHKTLMNSVNTTDVAGIGGSNPARWERVWYLDGTDGGGAMHFNMTFNIADAGMGNVNAGPQANYKLIYRAAQTGTWTVVAGANSVSGSNINFTNMTLFGLSDGYFTLASTDYATATLPVELLSFNARANNTHTDINWSTATEKNSAYFIVEKTLDGQSYETVAKVMGAGTSNSLKYYSLIDPTPYPGISYYRLRQVDTDGSEHTYPLVSVEFAGEKSVRIFPNPADDQQSISIELKGYEQQPVTVSITDLQGRSFYRNAFMPESNLQLLTVEAPSYLSQGTYVVQIVSQEKQVQKLLIVD